MKYKLQEILSLTLDMAEAMIKCGSDVSRVEDSIRIICNSYKVKYIEAYATNSLIIVTLRNNDEAVTESRRIKYINTNLSMLEEVNSLSREICANNVGREIVLKKLDSIKSHNHYLLICFGNLLAAFSFTLFFKGNVLDAIISSFIALILYLSDHYLNSKNRSKIIYNFMNSFIIGIIAVIFSKFITTIHFDKIIIGDIMLLIPGLSMFISIYDIFKGDTLSGTIRFIEGMFLALSIALGILLSLLLGGLI